MRQTRNPVRKPAQRVPRTPERHGRRLFLRRTALSAAGLALVAGGGCTPISIIMKTPRGPGAENEFAMVAGEDIGSPRELPDIENDWGLLSENFRMFTQRKIDYLKRLREEWVSLSEFVRPDHLSFGQGLSSVQRLVFPVHQGKAWGSGTLITPRHILTAAHVVARPGEALKKLKSPRRMFASAHVAIGEGIFIPPTQSGYDAGAEKGESVPRIIPIDYTLNPKLDLALLTLPQGAFGMDASVPLAKLHSGGPRRGSRVYVLGYPIRDPTVFGYHDILARVDCISNLYSPEASFLAVNALGEEPLVKKMPFYDYRTQGAPNHGGLSGAPVVSRSGKILGTFGAHNYIEKLGAQPNELLMASGSKAIRILVTDYLIDSVAIWIRHTARELRKRLSISG